MRALLYVGVLVTACGAQPPLASAPAELGPGTVAVAGSLTIPSALARDVASQSGQTPRQAVDALVFDAVFAQGATARKLDQRSEVRLAQRSARARFVSERLALAAAAKGPPTDAEVAALTARHWRDVDLPEQARAVHVVVMAAKEPQKKLRARQVAEDLRKAVVGARDTNDFIARAKLVDTQGLEIRPETLPMFVADGRVVDGNGELDKTFCTATFALEPGETSGIVETTFGLHIIRLLERLPGKQLPFEERKARFQPEIFAKRGHDAYVALLGDLKRTHPVTLAPSSDELMASATIR